MYVLFLSILFTFPLLFVAAELSHWPIPRCLKNDPELDKCVLEAARISIPIIKNGNKDLKIPRLDPLSAGDYPLPAHSGPVSLDLILDDLIITGASNINISTMSFNKKTFGMFMDATTNATILESNYVLTGTLFLIPIKSAGRFKCVIRDIHNTNNIFFIPKKMENKSFVETKINYKIISFGEVEMDFQNPSIGEWANNALNKLLNNNSRLLFSTFLPVTERVVNDLFFKKFKAMADNFSFDEFFPDSMK